MPGDGAIDLKLFMQIAKELEYDGYLSIGVYNQSLWLRDPYEVANEGLSKMKLLG
jgi:sugar phosphate isomerase/epimerase